jgi:hypothetical protein
MAPGVLVLDSDADATHAASKRETAAKHTVVESSAQGHQGLGPALELVALERVAAEGYATAEPAQVTSSLPGAHSSSRLLPMSIDCRVYRPAGMSVLFDLLGYCALASREHASVELRVAIIYIYIYIWCVSLRCAAAWCNH